jgi:glycosyltransferase involved in cell wall biosynthesis
MQYQKTPTTLPRPAIVFSYDVFSVQKFGGVSRCFIEMLKNLVLTRDDWSVWAGRHRNALLRESANQDWCKTHIFAAQKTSQLGRLGGNLFNEIPFVQYVKSENAKIVHRTYHPPLDLLPSKIKVVETLHDMMDEMWVDNRSRTQIFRTAIKKKSLHRADAIICVSETTQNALRQFWPDLAQKSIVIKHGANKLSDAPIKVMRAKPYFLFVGDRSRYKNFFVILRALSQSQKLHDFELICFGGKAFSPEELATLERLNLHRNVVQLSGSDELLAGLYEAATALVYPSAYEGFGLPLLEAMMHSCPVIASPLTSLPEVGGEACFYADPLIIEDWTNKMETVAYSTFEKTRLISAGLQRAKIFSWRKSSELHHQLYANL